MILIDAASGLGEDVADKQASALVTCVLQ